MGNSEEATRLLRLEKRGRAEAIIRGAMTECPAVGDRIIGDLQQGLVIAAIAREFGRQLTRDEVRTVEDAVDNAVRTHSVEEMTQLARSTALNRLLGGDNDGPQWWNRG